MRERFMQLDSIEVFFWNYFKGELIMPQCELLMDNNDMEREEKIVDFRKAGYTYGHEERNVL